MKVSDLFEATLKGPGDYHAGDEDIPGSPDYNPTRRTDYDRLASKRHANYIPGLDVSDPEGEISSKRQDAAIRARAAFTEDSKIASGEYNGNPYNLVVRFVGPAQGIKHQVDKFLDYHRNIHHEFAGTKFKEGEDGSATAYIFINAEPSSLVMQSAKYQASQK